MDERSDNVQPQPRAGLLPFEFQPEPHETAENLASQMQRDATTVVGDPHQKTIVAVGAQADIDPRRRSGVFHCVVDQVAKDNVQIDPSSNDDSRLQIEVDRIGGYAIVHAHACRAASQQFIQRDVFILLARSIGLEPPGVEHLVDQVVEPLQVFEHEAVKVGLQLHTDVVAAEGLQVELHRCDRRLELVGDAVDEIGLSAGKVDGLDRKDQIEHHADHQQQDERGTDRQQRPINARKLGVLQSVDHQDQHPPDGQDHQ